MTPELDHTKNKLDERKRELVQRISNVKKDISRKVSADWSEQAQERENDEVLEAIGTESRNELIKINHALNRLASGEYIYCSHCGGSISLERLNAVPYTDLCIHCAGRKSLLT